jgi:predicted nucleic acid-binding protein
MSAVAWAEFLCGPLGPAECELAERIIAERVPFAEQDAVLAAELFNDSGRRRGTLIDCMLASVALRAGAAFATRNPSDFRRLEARGLRLVNA